MNQITFDLEKFKANGQAYIDDLVSSMANECWENLKFSKFQNSSPEELELMHSIWFHGFMKGAETSTVISCAVINSKPNKP